MSNAIFYGLLHISDGQLKPSNLRSSQAKNSLEIYVNNAVSISRSLQLSGYEYILLTNNSSFLFEKFSVLKEFNVKVIDIPFDTKIKSGIKFYSAHYKLDVFRYFSKLNIGYHILCDLDMLCISKFQESFDILVRQSIPMVFDISNLVIPAYGESIVYNDLKLISGKNICTSWYGGEFIGGESEFFDLLIKKVDCFLDRYFDCLAKLNHVGDEAVTSVALNILMYEDNLLFKDVSALGIVNRYWSRPVKHFQLDKKYYLNSSLIHLPADKVFISSISNLNINSVQGYKNLYIKYLTSLKFRIIYGLKYIKFRYRNF